MSEDELVEAVWGIEGIHERMPRHLQHLECHVVAQLMDQVDHLAQQQLHAVYHNVHLWNNIQLIYKRLKSLSNK